MELLADAFDKFPTAWSPDGRFLLYMVVSPRTANDLWVLPLEGDRQPRPYLRKPANEFRAAVSPDGRWLSYNSDESGRTEGYVQSFPAPGRRYQVTTDGTGVVGSLAALIRATAFWCPTKRAVSAKTAPPVLWSKAEWLYTR